MGIHPDTLGEKDEVADAIFAKIVAHSDAVALDKSADRHVVVRQQMLAEEASQAMARRLHGHGFKPELPEEQAWAIALFSVSLADLWGALEEEDDDA